MITLKIFVGFLSKGNFTLKKKIEMKNVTSTDIPVLISNGAKFSEIYSERDNAGNYYFTPYGILSPGERIKLTTEEINYWINNKCIELF